METIYFPLTWLLSYILDTKSSSPIQVRHLVNLQKGFTGLVVVFSMFYFNNFNPGLYLYLSLHGTYGLVWLLKDSAFPDSSFNGSVTALSSILITSMLLLYWLPIIILASGQGNQFPSPMLILQCVSLNTLGSVIMMASDAQKYFTLQNKPGLITTAMFKYTRSPNFLGEFMIYFSFAHCVGTFETYALIFGVFSTVVFTSTLRKEISNKKKKGWKAYEDRTFMVLPKVIPGSSLASYLVYAVVFVAFKVLV